MRFKEFLKEGAPKELSEKEIITAIKKDCKQHIQLMKKGQHLYRGIDTRILYGEKKVRKNRKPKDSSIAVDVFLNKFLKEKGLPLRSESLFTTQMPSVAKMYGCQYGVYPKGDYSFVYFEKFRDLYAETPSFVSDYYDHKSKKRWVDDVADIEDMAAEDGISNSRVDFFSEFTDMFYDYQTKKIDKHYKGEIAIKCDSYYLVHIEEYHRILHNFI